MVDTLALGASGATRAGSSPVPGTNIYNTDECQCCIYFYPFLFFLKLVKINL